jgi:aryl-phospho-beta-D-glucosidase BglC (GH1 family)
LFRFPFRWQRVQHEVNGPLDFDDPKSDIKEIKKVIAEAERIGMYVMLDMHDYCRRKVNGTTYKFGESENLTKEHFADVWTKLATEFKDFTNIWGYDIMNEPYGLSPGVWLQAAQAAINGIRTVDTKTPIVVEGESYASASTWPTTGGSLINLTDPNDNLIYSAHCYFDKDKSGLYVLGDYDKEVGSPTQHIDRLAPYVNWLKQHNKQGILGEFGVPRNDVRWLKMLDEVLAYLKENKVSGTYWVGGNGYAGDHVSIQPLETYTVERAQIRVLGKYFATFGSPTDIADVVSKELNICQSATFDGVTVESEVGIKMIRIVNLSGHIVKTVNVNNNRTDVDLSEMPTGIYILQVVCKDAKTVTGKIAKM